MRSRIAAVVSNWMFPVAMVVLLGWPGSGFAQSDADPLTIGWTNAPPYLDMEEKGDVFDEAGFFIDLASAIGEELGRPIEVVRYPTIQTYFAAQHSGETDIAAGVSNTAFLQETNLISKPVAQARVRFFGRVGDVDALDVSNVSGRKIGTIPPTIGSQITTLLERNTEIKFSTVQEALFALLGGEIDGLLASQGTVFHLVRSAGVDDRIVPIGPPIQSADRVIAIHSSRPELVEPVNAAIDRLAASGSLAALRRRYLLENVAPVPETLRVAVRHLPPYMIVEDGAAPGGFSIEVFEQLAARAGLNYELREVSAETSDAVAFEDGADIFVVRALAADNPTEFDVSQPFKAVSLSAFVRRDGPATVPNDLSGLRVGLKPDIEALVSDGAITPEDTQIFGNETDLLDALLDGRVDAVLEDPDVFLPLAASDGRSEDIRQFDVDVPPVKLGFGMRHGLGPVRAVLDSTITGFTFSEPYRRLHAAYFEPPQPWSPAPGVIAGGLGALAVILLLTGLLFQSARARQRADALVTENRSVSSRLAGVLDAANSGIFGLSLDGRIVFANAGARHMLGGLNLDLPTDWPENIRFLDSEDLTPLDVSRDPVNRALAGQTIKGETTIMSRRGSADPRYTRVSSAPLSPDISPEIGTVFIIDDVSEQEKTRQQVERSSRLDALGQLTGGIAHDFNNLLAAIKYSIQLASVAKEDEKRDEYTDIALKSVVRGSTLTQRLLAFAKRQPGVAKSRQVEGILRELEELMRPTIEEHIALDFVVDDPNLWVFVDVAQLENAVLNLVLNSRDAIMRSGQGNRITVKARSVAEIDADLELRNERADTYIAQGLYAEHKTDRRRQDGKAFRYVEFSVTDNGPGMDDETKRRAIDPFFTTKDSNSGTGLGLSMVYGFIQQADGEMRIYSEPGHGTTIRLLLPRGSTGGRREEPVERMPAPTGSGQTVLIVEDEPDLLRIMSDLVTSLGYTVRAAPSGSEGLKMIESGEKIDVLLTDIVMPGGIGGFSLAEAARERRPELPIIYMSGYTGISASEMGNVVAPLIQKPSPPYMLAEALEEALAIKKPQGAARQ